MSKSGKKRVPVNIPKFSIPVVQTPPPQAIAPANLDSSALIVLEGQQFTVGADELETLKELGRGAYGIVEQMRHKPTGTLMAVKRITFSFDEAEKRNALMDLSVNMKAECEYTVRFYGAFFREGDIWICMEVMDTSLDKFYKAAFAQCGGIPEEALGRISYSIVTALDYLKEELKIMHRDVKPSNVLINAQGAVKLCDFGISGQMVDSVAKSNLGCKPYMPPERIEAEIGATYDVRSDVWSLGITMVELSIGNFPYPSIKNIFEQLKQVVQSDPPRLPAGKFSREYEIFIEMCLQKNRENRAKYRQLLDTEFLRRNKDNDIAEFASSVISQMN
uniref:mitogen-activated protein kinase kinase n=1 Tax=Neoseiulus californicus TaxID=84382 RepID=A0A9E9J3J5_9ACAR|nr:mitogen-activated protein kinase kinase 6 [Neoseiulus californicus]